MNITTMVCDGCSQECPIYLLKTDKESLEILCASCRFTQRYSGDWMRRQYGRMWEFRNTIDNIDIDDGNDTSNTDWYNGWRNE